MRYHYVAGPEFTPNVSLPAGTPTGGSANGVYYPLTFGVRV